ncbi:protein kinase [Malaciobacter pacificus]|uniref:Serine/threonine-protein kinase/phosphatase n=1 Tax=Malaciobacter pacificus TaxID=1080223 RepID=A0A5C2H926_9BACT|nr:bifunctional protein-serine/threonine kinase/phosphatase [Malaciobacter pacificus]QEP35401.1 serine/threonine-protein kinase/phosphatase [Malaciobacter pacificus]GGD38751.1 protein kinase [Malaciobacter pacificus]
MNKNLSISYGHYSTKGIKQINQDYHDYVIPKEPLLTTKGITVCIADGISSSNVSQEASRVSVQSFLEDYYCTSEAWSVETSGTKVLSANNSWLYAKNKENRYHLEKDSGFVCTFSGLVLKSTTAHIFHVGDIRIYKLRNNELTQLTTDHRTWVSNEKSYLARAMGIDCVLNIDYKSTSLEKDDVFLLMSDGVYEFISNETFIEKVNFYEGDLNLLSEDLVNLALENGSDDNLTLQIVKIDNLPNKDSNELVNEITEKPTPELLSEGDKIDGFEVLKVLNKNSRSHVYLIRDEKTNKKVVLKAPSHEKRDDIAYLESFLLEDWIARRINNKYVVKAYDLDRPKDYLYILTQYFEGQTLTQWMRDNPKPALQEIRAIISQIASGLQAFHTLEMVNQDLRPENILINKDNQIKIIDFGATKVEGIMEIDSFAEQFNIQGTALYTAPEYFIGEQGSAKSDIFSLAVIIYHMLSGEFPYGNDVAKSTSKSAQNRLKYKPLVHSRVKVPQWFEEALKKGLSVSSINRYNLLSEFIYDLEKPNKNFSSKHTPAIMEKDPVTFWKVVALILLIINTYLVLN